MNQRYVIYSDEFGIYLASSDQGTLWSKNVSGLSDDAPTFTKEEFTKFLNRFKSPLPTHRLVEVHPDRPDNRVSMDACANAQLPRWTA